MDERQTRRVFLQETAGVAAAAAALKGIAGPAAEAPARKLPAGELPRIKLGTLEVSRLLLGSNSFWGGSHGSKQATPAEYRAWYTPERIMLTLNQAFEQGITGVWANCTQQWLAVWDAYRKQNGKMKVWIAQPNRQPMDREIDAAIDHGASAVFAQGIRTDEQVRAGRWDVVAEWMERIQRAGLPAGIATHQVDTHVEAEKRGIPVDFFHQCLYRHPKYDPKDAAETLAVVEKLTKPVVVYKALGAGRFMPKDALPEVFRHLKPKDGVCIGVFNRDHDEIAEAVALVRRLSGVGHG
jgi:hypothetical protein